MKALAAIAYSPCVPMTVAEVQLDSPRQDEVLVEIHAVGICHSDVAYRDQHIPHPLPAVFGHEGAGVVREVGSSVTKVKPGDRVLLTFRSCGECVGCRDGAPAYCDQAPKLNSSGGRPDGSRTIHEGEREIASNFFGQSSFADHAIAYESNIVLMPTDIPLHVLAPLSCGVQTGAGGIMRSLACEAGSSILVIGAGAVGLGAVMAAAVQQCGNIIVSEPNVARRQLALELGATHLIDPTAKEFGLAVREICPRGVDYVFDTSGRADVIDEAIRSMSPRGTIGLVGVPRDMTTALTTNLIMLVGLGHTIRGIVEGDSNVDEFIGEMIGFVRDGRFPVQRMIQTFPFENINDAIAATISGDCVKAVLLTAAGRAAAQEVAA